MTTKNAMKKIGFYLAFNICISILFLSGAWACQLSGNVSNMDGVPIPDVELTAVLASTGDTAGTGTSNTSGAYSISIEQGAYNIIVTPPQTSNYKSTTVEGITITGDTIQNVILVPKGITLSGRVLDRNNNGVKEVFVKVVNPCESIWVSLENTVGWGRTDTSGNYNIVVPAGTYDIIIRAYSGTYICNKLNPQYAYYRVTEDLKIESALIHNISMPIVYLTGTVVNANGAPVSGVTIGNECTYSYKYRSGKCSYNYAVYNGYATSGTDGRFNFPVFKATSYNFIVTPPSSSLCTKQFINGIPVTQDTIKNITLANAPVLSGRVLDRNNKGVKDVFVKVVNPCESIWVSLESTVGWGKTDCNGNYSVVVPAGTYDIIIRAYSGTYIYNKLNPQYAYYRVTEDLKIESALTHNINLPIVYLTGTVVNAAGVPVPGVTIQNECTYSYKYRSGKFSYNYAVYNGYATSGTDGRYNFPVFKATYNIIVTPPSGSLYTKQFINGLCVTTDTTKNITLVNAPVLSGRVLDRNNNGVKDVFVKVVNPCESIWVSLESSVGWGRTDCNGNYSVVVPAGTYDIIIRAYSGTYIYNKLNPQYAYYRVTEDLKIEESLIYNINLPIVYLTGTVVNAAGVPVPGVKIQNECTYSYKYRSGKFSYNYAVYNGYATSGTDGRFNFPVFKATYNIIVTPPSGSPYTKQFINNLCLTSDTTLDITLVNAPVLSGRVLDRNNNGVKDVFVKVVNPCESIWVSLESSVGWGKTDCNGNYSVVVPPGTYDIIIRAYSGSYIYNKLNPQYAYYRMAEDIKIEADLTNNINLPIVYLTGIVVNAAGVPVPGVTIQNECTYSYKYRSGKFSYNYAVYNGCATSGTDGRFSFPVFKATYNMIVTPPSASGYAKFRIGALVMNQDITKIIILEDEKKTPTAEAGASPTSGLVPLTVQLTGKGTDADGTIVKYEWDFDGNGTYDWSSVSSGNTAYTYNETGIYSAKLQVTDNDGLSDTDSVTITVIIDTTPPVIGITSPVNGYITKESNINVSGTVSDNIGIAKVTVNNQTAEVSGSKFVINGVAVTEGTNIITAEATDTSGNTKSVSITVTKDTTPPDIGITSPANGFITNADSVNVAGSVSDNIGIAKVTVNNQTAQVSGNTFTLNGLTLNEGANTITAEATDTAGNVKSVSIIVTKDTMPPSISITSPIDGYKTAATTINVYGTVTDNVGISKVVVNNYLADVSGGIFTAKEIPLSPGKNTITAEAVDIAGNTKSMSITVITPILPQDGQVAYWKMDEESGIREDSSGNQNHLSPSPNPPGYAKGEYDNAVKLVESDHNYLVIENDDQKDLYIEGDITISVWVYVNSYPKNDDFIIVQRGENYQFSVYNNGKFVFESGKKKILSKFKLKEKEWYRLTAVREGDYAYLYINGSPDGSKKQKFTKEIEEDAELFVGYNDKYCTDGLIDELVIWNRALSKEEISDLYEDKPVPNNYICLSGQDNGINYAPTAQVTASSEYSSYYSKTNVTDGLYGLWDQGEWAAQGWWDRNPWIALTFNSPIRLNKIILYGRPNKFDKISNVKLLLSNGYSAEIGEIPIGGASKIIYFPEADIQWVKLEIVETIAMNPGLAEIQLFYNPNIEDNPNLAISAVTSASSEYSASFRAGNAIDGIIGQWNIGEWAACGSFDRGAWLKLTWDSPQSVNKLVIYGRPNKFDSIKNASITLSNGYTTMIGEIPIGGAPKVIYLPGIQEITWLKFQVVETDALNPGLTEIEVYNEDTSAKDCNLAQQAKAAASSQYNDSYKASNAIDGVVGQWDIGEWAACGSYDKAPWLKLTWDTPQTINKIIIYGRPNKFDSISNAGITLSNGYNIRLGEIPLGGAPKEIYIPISSITWLEFKVLETTAQNPGLTEIEVYDSTQ